MSGFSEFVKAVETYSGRPGRRSGRNVRLLCPGHEDHDPSLDVAEGDDGRPLVKCRSHDCSFELICEVLAVDPSSFLAGTDHPKPIVTYDYRDEAGALLFQSVRLSPKAFRQRRPDGRGSWINDLAGVRRVPYRLPELLAAASGGRTVWIAEGEKDVDSLVKLGLIATCNPMGAGKRIDDYVPHFIGASGIIVIADSETEGRAHAQEWVRALSAHGLAVKLLDLAPDKNDGYDVSDFLAEHGHQAKALLLESAKTTPTLHPNAPCIIAMGDPAAKPVRTRWLLPGIPLGEITLLAGELKVGKSLLTIAWAAAITRGDAGAAPRNVAVLLNAEDDWPQVMLPRLIAAGAILDRIAYYAMDGHDGITIPDDVPALELALEPLKPALLCVDPVTEFLAADFNKRELTRRAVRPLHDMCRRQDCALLLLEHLNKTQTDIVMHRISGAIGGLPARARSIFMLAQENDECHLVHLASTRGPREPNRIYRMELVNVTMEDGTLEPFPRLILDREEPHSMDVLTSHGFSEPERARNIRAEEFLLAELAHNGSALMRDLHAKREERGVSKSDLYAAVDALGLKYCRIHGLPALFQPEEEAA